MRRAQRQAPAARLSASQPTVDEERSAGERLMADRLGLELDDDWNLLRGGNRGGEIDHLLLDPRGLFAIEVKNQNARVDCHGDQ